MFIRSLNPPLLIACTALLVPILILAACDRQATPENPQASDRSGTDITEDLQSEQTDPAQAQPTMASPAPPTTTSPTSSQITPSLPRLTTSQPLSPRPFPDRRFGGPVQALPAGYRAPDRDLAELAARLRKVEKSDGPLEPAAPLALGLMQQFTLTDLDDGSPRSISATLRLVTENVYWFVDDDIQVDQEDLEHSAREFESTVRPTIVAAFGDISSPGLDGDPRLTILHSRLEGAAGYFGSKDGYPTEVHPYSNEREIIYVDAHLLPPGSAQYLAVIAHEFQHAVHSNQDESEDSWVNEGLSELATELAGYPTHFTPAFLRRPNTQLNYWPDGSRATPAHYGAAHLFFRYLVQRTGGPSALLPLVVETLDGIDGVDSFLLRHDLTFDEVFADWVVANYLDADDRRYGYLGHDVKTGVVRTLGPGSQLDDRLSQYAARYFRVGTGANSGFLIFHGDSAVRLVREGCQTGPTCWWSGRGDAIDSTLTRQFDLTSVSKATLEYSVWHEIEEGWDFAYVQVSTDGGDIWQVLEGTHTTSDNPSGNAYGPAYSGRSRGWRRESIDLSPFTGGNVLIRFEYVTDDAVYRDGLLIDDVSIPELGFQDSPTAAGEWASEGFIRAGNHLPQSFIVQILQIAHDGGFTVSKLPLDDRNYGHIGLNHLGDAAETIVIVSPTARSTSHTAGYTLSFK